MRRRFGVVLALAVIAAAGWWWFPFSRQGDDARTSVALSEEKLESTTPVPPQPLEARRNEIAPEERRAPATTDITILGRCVDAGGKAAPDVAFVLERFLRPGGFEPIERLPAFDERTNASGTFELRAPAAEHLRLTLKLLDPRFVRREWSWKDLVAGSREDVGEIALVPGASVRGRVLDSAGAPIRAHWRVQMGAVGVGWAPHAQAEENGGGTERFEITGLPAGTWQINARYPTFEIARAKLELTTGETRDIDLRQTGGRDPWREIVVRVETARSNPQPDRQHVRLIAPGGVIQTLDATDPSNGNFRFIDLEPGVYRVQIDDPRYETWSFDHAEPGPKPIEAQLIGNSAIELAVVDAFTQQPVLSYAFELVRRGWTVGSEDLLEPRKPKPRPDGRTSLSGLVAGDLRFVLQAEGWPARLVEIEDLAPGERRAVKIELHRGVTLSGTVQRAGSAKPIAGASVLLIRPALVDDGLDSILLPPHSSGGDKNRVRKVFARTSSAVDGSFRFESVQPGKWILLAVVLGPGEELGLMISSFPIRALRDVLVEAARAPEPVVLELPAVGSIYGRAAMPESFRRERMALQLFRAIESLASVVNPNDYAESNWDAKLVATVFLDPSGAYRFDDLAPGTYRIAAAFSEKPDDQVAPESRAGLTRRARNLAELELATGAEVRRDLDLTAVAPAEVRARLDATGGDLGTTVLHIQLAPSAATGSPIDLLHQSAPFDAQREAIHAAVLPGRKIVFAVGGAWLHVFEHELEMAAGTTHELAGTVTFYAGELEVEDVDGRPLANSEVGLGPVWDASIPLYSPGASYTLDGRARTRVVLPEGRYRIGASDRGGASPHFAELAWPAGELVKVQLREGR